MENVVAEPGQNRLLALVRGRVQRPSQPRYANHRQGALRELAYQMHCVGKSYRVIGEELGINRETAMLYVRHRTKERNAEFEALRDQALVEACEFYDVVAVKALETHEAVQTALEAIAENPNFEGDVRIVASGILGDALKARERKDKLLGLEAPLKVDLTAKAFAEAICPPDKQEALLP